MFSIIIPTWNNLSYLKLCVESIRKHSTLPCQVILHINDGSDGTLSWAIEQGIEFTHTVTNQGICIGVNMAARKVVNDYIIYMNDDMYCCPGWDTYLAEEISGLTTDKFMISATMIEPRDTGNATVIVADFGQDVFSFKEQELLAALPHLKKDDWSGASWPPCVISTSYWHMIGGFSIEFSPGMASDDDFSMKLWFTNCRYFKGVGKSLVYHFQTKTTSRIKKNNGSRQFLLKWGVNGSIFNKYFIRKGQPFTGILEEPSSAIIRKNKIKTWLKKRFIL
ncbi:MAG: glycosyltransferase [Ferruginibacter sp.]